MLIGLYTTRVVLHVLGQEDFGTYNAVAGIVLLFAFLSSTMATASQRFFAMELGVDNHIKLKQVFSINVLIFIGLALIIFVFSETIGLWYLKTKIVIPLDRVEAAGWVYQFAIITIMTNIITIPYLAIITAREKMQVYAYLSILEVAFKLGIVFVLIYIPTDKLKLYAVLMFIVQILISASYISYATLKFPECRIKYYWNKNMFKEVVGFAGWNVLGSLSMTARGQGVMQLLNQFFGVLMNAALSVSYQVYSALTRLVDGFFTAVRPQIVKSYSFDKEDTSGEMMKLVFQSSKFCFYLVLMISIPILIETKSILALWLNNKVPDSSLIFTRLMIITAIIESLAYPLITSINATGKIKKYQLFASTVILLILPVSYLFLKLGFPPQITMYVMIVAAVLAQIGRIYFMKSMLKMNVSHYLKQVIFPVSVVTILTFVLPLLFYRSFDASFWRIVGVTATTVVSSVFTIYFVGLTKTERMALKTFVISKIFKTLR